MRVLDLVAGWQPPQILVAVPVTRITRDGTYQSYKKCTGSTEVGRTDSSCPGPTHLAGTPTRAVVSVCLTLSAIPQATSQITRRTPCSLARGGQGCEILH